MKVKLRMIHKMYVQTTMQVYTEVIVLWCIKKLFYFDSNLPEGQSFKFFLEICEACGEMYGSATAHFCLIEREQSTYYKCLMAMGFKR